MVTMWSQNFIYEAATPTRQLPWWLSGNESACQAGDLDSFPGEGSVPLAEPTPVFLPGKSQSMGWKRVRHHLATKRAHTLPPEC